LKTGAAIGAFSPAIGFTANVTGGSGSYDYQFWVEEPGTGWSIKQTYGNGNTYSWTPNTAGTYVVAVWARNIGSPANFEMQQAVNYTIGQ
jgi:hypothetical protein